MGIIVQSGNDASGPGEHVSGTEEASPISESARVRASVCAQSLHRRLRSRSTEHIRPRATSASVGGLIGTPGGLFLVQGTEFTSTGSSTEPQPAPVP